MYSFQRITTRGTVLAIVILLLAQSNTASGYPDGGSSPAGTGLEAIQMQENPTEQQKNAQSMYGRGVILGSYLQASAFILGFWSLDDLDPTSQFAGLILAFQLLVRWWTRYITHDISISELWVCLAQLLLFTTPGAFLLFSSFSLTRRDWKTTTGKEMLPKEVIRGQGLSFLQVFLILFAVNATNVGFVLIITRDLAPKADRDKNPIWMGTNWEALSDVGIWLIMGLQAGLTVLCEGLPYTVYLCAWWGYVRDVDRAGKIRRYDQASTDGRARMKVRHECVQREQARIQHSDDEERENPSRMHRAMAKVWSHKTVAKYLISLVAFLYALMLAISIELTIRAASLEPAGNLLDSGQLLPFLAGILSLLSAIVNFFVNWFLSKTPVRYEKQPGGDYVIFTKNGECLEQEHIELLAVPPLLQGEGRFSLED